MKKLFYSLVTVAMMGVTSLLSAEEAEKSALCDKCGQILGSEICCQPDAVKCEKCGKDEGSPGCCQAAPVKPAEDTTPKDHPAH